MWKKKGQGFDKNKLSFYFFGALVIILVVTCALTFNVLSLIKGQTKAELRTILETVLRSTHNNIKTWALERKQDLEAISIIPGLKKATRILLNPPAAHPRKKMDSVFSRVQDILQPEIQRHDYAGFLIISKDATVLASSFDGKYSRGHFPGEVWKWLKPSFDGKTVMSPPLDPQNIFPKSNLKDSNLLQLIVIYTTPLLRNKDGVEVILAFLSSPKSSLSKGLKIGWLGKTGETYALSNEGVFLSESRFQKKLLEIGLLHPTQKEVLTLVSLDPGGNLTQGFQPVLPRKELPLTLMAAELAKRKSGFNVTGYRDYRGVPVIGVWMWDDDLQFGLATEWDVSEAYSTFYQTRRLLVSLMLATILFFIVPTVLSRISAHRKRESEKGFKALFQESNDIILLINSSTYKIADANKKALKVFGYQKDDLPSLSLREIHPADIKETIEFIESVKKGPGRTRGLTCRTKSGEFIPVDVSAFPLKVMGQSYVVCSARDTRDQIKARKELNEEKARLSAIINNTVDSIIVIDEKGRVEEFNPAAEKMTGYKKEQILNKNINILMPEPDKSQHDEYIKRFLRTGERRVIGLNREMWVQKKSGGIFPAKLAVSQATWGDKRVFIGTFLDLSEQKKAHGIIIQAKEGLEKKVKKRTQELVNEKASMEVLRVVAEGANELGNVDEATLLCIKKVCEFLNWEAGHAYEVSQMQKERLIPTKLFYFEGEDENLEVFKTQIHSQALIEGVCIPGNIMRDQKIKLFDELDRMCTNCLRDKLISRLGFKMGLGFPILVGNEVAGVLEFFTKTGPKPSAKTLKTLEHIGVILGRAVERDRVDRMKTEFLSTAAHELRTPMTTIKGYSELMMKRELPKVKADRFISLINKESVHLTHIVNDLLDVARIESGDGFVVSMERGDISLVVKEEINLFRESYPNHRFDLTVSGQPMNISFDEGKIRQVIKNLLSNAAKYSPQGGTVLTRLEYSSEGVSCSFLDEGMGMNAEQVKRIFERFYRVDESGAIKGTGLGMAIVKHIIEAHRGKIWVESAIGKGTIIHFNISNFPSGSIQESIKKSV